MCGTRCSWFTNLRPSHPDGYQRQAGPRRRPREACLRPGDTSVSSPHLPAIISRQGSAPIKPREKRASRLRAGGEVAVQRGQGTRAQTHA